MKTSIGTDCESQKLNNYFKYLDDGITETWIFVFASAFSRRPEIKELSHQMDSTFADIYHKDRNT
jgi:hypothetical protein